MVAPGLNGAESHGLESNGPDAITISRAQSLEDARRLLLAATPPNSSYTQQRNFSVEQIDRALELGFRKPEWVWLARDSAGDTAALVAGWGSEQRRTPIVIDFFDLPLHQPAIVRSLLDRVSADCAEPGRSTVDLIYFLPAQTPLDDPGTAGMIEALAASGFRLLVRRHRYRLEIATDPVAIPPTRLRFEAATGADDPRLRTVMAEILIGSLDAHDVDGLERAHRDHDGEKAGDHDGDHRDTAAAAELALAEETIAEYLGMDAVESMFLSYDPQGELVGLVIGGLRGSGVNGTASFIGVSHLHRGNGYAAQLLGFITGRMIADGAAWIIGETDDGNFPMVAAFAKVGYPTSESRLDFVRELG